MKLTFFSNYAFFIFSLRHACSLATLKGFQYFCSDFFLLIFINVAISSQACLEQNLNILFSLFSPKLSGQNNYKLVFCLYFNKLFNIMAMVTLLLSCSNVSRNMIWSESSFDVYIVYFYLCGYPTVFNHSVSISIFKIYFSLRFDILFFTINW